MHVVRTLEMDSTTTTTFIMVILHTLPRWRASSPFVARRTKNGSYCSRGTTRITIPTISSPRGTRTGIWAFVGLGHVPTG